MTEMAMSQQAGRSRLVAHVAMVGYALLIAGSFSFGSLAAPYIPPTVLNAVRFLAATLLMGGFAMLRGDGLRLPRAPWRFLLLGALMGAYFVMMFVALRITDPVSTGAVFTLIPLLAAIFGYFILGQRTRAAVWSGLLIAATGALWVIFRGDPAKALAFHVGKGEVIFFLGCICQALYAPLVRLLNKGESVLEFTVWTLAGCTICVTLFAGFDLAQVDWAGLSLVVWLSLAYLTVFATAISFFLLQYGSMYLPAAKVFPYGYLIPSFVIGIEALLGHGLIPGFVAIGAGISVLGLLVLLLTADAK
jgi:drug/metabolite transporter (DMT)-like permease